MDSYENIQILVRKLVNGRMSVIQQIHRSFASEISREEEARFTKIYRGFAWILARIAYTPAIANTIVITLIDFQCA